jgi:hypothetical protein
VAVEPKKRNNTSEIKTIPVLKLVSGVFIIHPLWEPIIDKKLIVGEKRYSNKAYSRING